MRQNIGPVHSTQPNILLQWLYLVVWRMCLSIDTDKIPARVLNDTSSTSKFEECKTVVQIKLTNVRGDNQHNDIQYNDTQHNNIQYDTQHNDIQYNDTQHNKDKQYHLSLFWGASSLVSFIQIVAMLCLYSKLRLCSFLQRNLWC